MRLNFVFVLCIRLVPETVWNPRGLLSLSYTYKLIGPKLRRVHRNGLQLSVCVSRATDRNIGFTLYISVFGKMEVKPRKEGFL